MDDRNRIQNPALETENAANLDGSQADFLQGDITSGFLSRVNHAVNVDLPVLITPTIILSLIVCPSMIGLSIAYCTG